MEEGKSTRPHVVCVPFPAQGHVIPMMQLAKLLHAKGFCVTFVNTEFNHRRLLRSRPHEDDDDDDQDHWVDGFDGFWFRTISDGLPPSDNPDATQNPTLLCYHLPRHCLAPFRSLLGKLNSSPEVNPPVTCVISDGAMSFALTAAAELGVPGVQFWTASACGFMAYLHYDELVQRGLFPFKDERFWSDGSLEREVEGIAGMRNMRFKDLPSFIRTTDPDHVIFNFMRTETQNCLQSSAIIFNTFDAFEHEVLEAIASRFPRVSTIGPLSLLPSGTARTHLSSFRPSFWADDAACLQWLDRREPGSVVYVNYGSVTVMSDRHLTEFAWGLADSNRPFLWIVRPDVVMGGSAVLPEEFVEAVKDRGLLASWCPQERVLSHPAVAVFLTHCGWNSMVESVSAGVPVICWPFFAEQQTNCRYACTDGWGIGMEVDEDVRRDEIAAVVKEMMEGERGKVMKRNAMEWKKKAEAATSVGGTSYNNFDSFIKEYIS